jgi:hypothetical protein
MKLVTGVGWHDGSPRLTWADGTDRGILPLAGPIRWAVGDRRCVGHRIDGHPVACPDRATLASGRQCAACQRADTFRPCMICTGFGCPRLTPAMRARCAGRHHLYLASFGGDRVKVGTASAGREDARLVEQGPLLAVRIASGSGPRIKQMEHLVSTRTPLVEAVRRSRKLTRLAVGGRVDVARGHVTAAIDTVRALLRDDYAEELHPPDWFEAPPVVARARQAAIGRTPMPVRPGTVLTGRIVGAIGPIALLDDAGARFLLDVGELVGRELDPDPPHDLPAPTVQLGLFA